MLILLSHKTQNENESKMKEILTEQELISTIALLVSLVSLLIYSIYRSSIGCQLYKWIDYFHNGQIKRSQVASISFFKMTMRNGDKIMLADVL